MASFLPEALCARLRHKVDHIVAMEHDTVDGADDYQLNLNADELSALLGEDIAAKISEVARGLDLKRGGSGQRPLPLTEAFVRKYTSETRASHPFHQDRAAVTVNIALSDDTEHAGGRLVGLFEEGVRIFERSAGMATVHLSRIVHGVSQVTQGSRYSLICAWTLDDCYNQC